MGLKIPVVNYTSPLPLLRCLFSDSSGANTEQLRSHQKFAVGSEGLLTLLNFSKNRELNTILSSYVKEFSLQSDKIQAAFPL